jgi:hypothetical protein
MPAANYTELSTARATARAYDVALCGVVDGD